MGDLLESFLNGIIKKLEKEDIRLIDGRWSGGFVDQTGLWTLIERGKAETYDNQGMTFVRLKKEN